MPTGDEFRELLNRVVDLCDEKGVSKNLTDRLHKTIKEFQDVIKLVLEEIGPVKLDDDEEFCPSCAGEEIPKIIQMTNAPPGWKAVFAEADSSDPTKMMVSDIVAFGVMQVSGDDTELTGITMGEDSMIPCEMIHTFIGYLKPGQDPSTLAAKVAAFLKEQKEQKE